MSSRRVLIEKIPLVPKKEAIGARVEELRHIISECQEEINELKSLCLHEKYEVGYYSWRIGSMDLRRICSYCKEVLGEHPSTLEQTDYYNANGNILNRQVQ